MMNPFKSSTLLALVTVVLMGCVQFGLFFSDKPAWLIKVSFAGLASLLGGTVLGLRIQGSWPLWCVGAAWGGLLAGGMLFLMRESTWWMFALSAVAGSLLGGVVGAAIRRRTAIWGDTREPSRRPSG